MRWTPVRQLQTWVLLCILSVLSTDALMSGSAPSPSADQDVDFARDIRPIFEANCNQCHGADQSMNGLRLDTREAALKGGQSGPAILPGDGASSLLYRKIVGDAPGSPMPLTGTLPRDQVEMIRTWLDQGAPWTEAIDGTGAGVKKHWAYVKPVRPSLPKVNDVSWVRNMIDRFVLERLEREGLEPSPEASRETLIRRVTLDLIGLPPTPEEVDAFVEDELPLAYERLVDRLLASPRYGERWARPWLDLARYADTNGYIHDRRRNMWLYRDWVIKAISSDMPFDQFTIEQIAGDLLTDATPEQKIATGFHRNTMINTEGGTDPEEYRVAAILDRVETTGTVWLGSTIACAQCHDHKYDPITQEEYFRMYAFFNNTMEENNPKTKVRPQNASITLPPAGYLSSHRSDIEGEIVELKAALKRSTPELEAARTQWETQTATEMVSWNDLDPVTYFSLGGAELTLQGDGSLLASGPKPGRETYVVVTETQVEGITAIRLETLTDPSLPHGGSSRSSDGEFILTEFEVVVEPLAAAGSSSPVAFSGAAAEIDPVTMGIRRALDGDPTTGWSNSGTSQKNRVERQAIFLPESPLGFTGGTRFTIRLRHEGEKPGKTIGRFRFSVTRNQDPARNVKLPTRAERILAVPAGQRTEGQRRILNDYYRGFAPLLTPKRQRLSELLVFWKQLTSPNSLVMKELEKPRTTHLFVKGSFLDPGKEVHPGVPSVLHALPESDTRPNRLTLARWLVSPENPLVGRVTMNRLWADHFGRPLVTTPENLGTQGERPTHPELLDWLATEFVDQNWSMKAMHRLMVTSAAYRQDSRMGEALRQKDRSKQ
ncbi:MAG: PSD1 and planctomycete cytochrome C domain-containing protein, partial [Candidatus Aminicenantes bacterium]|nr:PSD1 and planctomycete cytochrome C domain-containing protein [Candidatus Aminicenantes bacterium]